MELRYDRKQESQEGGNEYKWNIEKGLVVRVVSILLSTQEECDQLGINLREEYHDIGRQERGECIPEKMIAFAPMSHDGDPSEIASIVPRIGKIKREHTAHKYTRDPRPHIHLSIAVIGKKQYEGRQGNSGHFDEFGSFLQLGILCYAKKYTRNMEDIGTHEIESRNTQDLDCSDIMEPDLRQPWSEYEQHDPNQYTRTYLEDECESKEILGSTVFSLDDIFWQKIIQTLGTTEIVECPEESYETDHRVDQAESTDCEIMRYDDLDEVSEWTDQECEKIEPKSLFDKFLCKSLF